MKLGPNQQKWVDDLRRYPERQYTGILGCKDKDGKIRACCLGQALLSLGIGKFNDNTWFLEDEGEEEGVHKTATDFPSYSYGLLGLIGQYGNLNQPCLIGEGFYSTLAQMNDCEVPWDVIADYIEYNPENVFTKSI